MRLRFYWLQAVGCIEERQWRMRGTGQTVCLRVIQRLFARCLRSPRSIGGFSGGNFRITTFERGRGGPEIWPIDLRFPTNRSIGIVVGNLNLVREKELGFPSQKRVGFHTNSTQISESKIFGVMIPDLTLSHDFFLFFYLKNWCAGFGLACKCKSRRVLATYSNNNSLFLTKISSKREQRS